MDVSLHLIVEIPPSILYDYNKLLKVSPERGIDIEKHLIQDYFEKNDSFVYHCIIKSSKIVNKINVILNIKSEFKSETIILSDKHSRFIYNIKFEEHKSYFSSNEIPPNVHKLSYYQQYEIYFQYITKNSQNLLKDKQDLINDTLQIINEEPIEFDIILVLLRECFRKPEIKQIIDSLYNKKIRFIHGKKLNPMFYKTIIDNLVGKFRNKIDKFIGDNKLQKEYALDLIALSFYRIFDIELFKKYIDENQNKKQLINILYNNEGVIGIFKEKIITQLLHYADDKELCNKVLSLSVDR